MTRKEKTRKIKYSLKMNQSKLKLGYSKILPFSGFYCINLFGVLIRRNKYKNTKISQTTYNHELTHTLQAEDFIPNPKNSDFKRILGYLIFYLIYIIEWIFKIICNIFYWKIRAYRSISFEQIAYKYQNDYNYQDTRKRFDWVPYISKFVLKD